MAKLKLVRYVSYEELVEMYRKEKDAELLAIKLYYEGKKDCEIAREMNLR